MAQPPAPGSSTFLGKLMLSAVALGPPALVSAGLWSNVQSHPVIAAGALLGWWFLIGLSHFAGKICGLVADKWAPRAADRVDLAAFDRSHRRRYSRSLAASLRYLDLAGVPTQGEYTLNLHDVYVDVSLVPNTVHDSVREPYLGALPPDPPSAAGRRVSLERFLADPGPVVLAVVAGPGSGKTTLLRHTALRRCHRRRTLPILLLLRDHVEAIISNPALTLAAAIAAEPWLSGAIPATWFEGRLNRGRCLVLLDGLDEVPAEENRRKVVEWVQAQINRYPRNNFVITSRPYGYESNPLPGATVLQVRRFTSEQISRFVRGWYLAVERRSTGEVSPDTKARASRAADDLLKRLRGQPALYDLAANPLLLTMICNVHKYRDALPGSRAELYEEMCEVLLHRRQSAKGVQGIETGLKGAQKEQVLREVALQMMRRPARDLPTTELYRLAGPPLARASRKVTAQAFVAEVERSGLLVERENSVHAFAHLTLQEHLAAVEIRETGQAELLARSVNDSWWRETTLLWAARADASAVVEACLRSGSVQALALAFDCQDEAKGLSPELRDALEEMLSCPADSERRQLMDRVAVARALRQVVLVGEDTEVCAAPVTVGLYQRFINSEAAQGRLRQPDIGPQRPSDDTPVSGVWDIDLEPFLQWIAHQSGGTVYRLPTQEELAEPVVRSIADIAAQPVWGTRHDQARPAPVTEARSAVDSFASSATTMRRAWGQDRLQAALLSLLVRDRDRGLFLDLDLTLDFNRRCVLDRVHDLDLFPDRNLALILDCALDCALDLDLTRDRDLDRDLALGFDLTRSRALDLVYARFFDRFFDLNLPRGLFLDRVLDRVLDRFLIPALAYDLTSVSHFVFSPGRSDELEDLRPTAYTALILSYLIVIDRELAIVETRRRKSRTLIDGDVLWSFDQRVASASARTLLPSEIGDRARAGLRSLSAVHGEVGPGIAATVQVAEYLMSLLESVLAREIRLTPELATCLRFGSMAIVAACGENQKLGEAAENFLDVAFGVTALEDRVNGTITPNDMIVLVRG